jgi:hypothetical protein
MPVDDSLYYAPRQDELPESTPDIGFLLGESEVALSPTAPDAEEKPVRLLRHWVVFDARPSKAKDAGGALTFAMVSLHVLDGLDAALDSTDAGCAPEGAGDASSYCENAGQEDDGNDSTGNEEEGGAVSTRLRLGAIMRYMIDYTKDNEYVPHTLFTCRCVGTIGWLMLGSAARYTSRPPWLGTSSASLRLSTMRSSRRSSVHTESPRSSCACSCMTHAPLSTRLSLSSSSRTAAIVGHWT